MTEKQGRSDALASWENEGGRIAAGNEPQEKVTTMKTNAIIGAVGLLVGVVLGGLCGAWFERRSGEERMAAAVQEEADRSERLAVEVSELQDRGTLRELHLRLGRIAIDASRQDYGTAGERAARLFEDLTELESQMAAGDPARPALRHVLAARDEIVAGLATAKPAAAEQLEELYLDLFSMMPSSSDPELEAAHETGS